MDLKRLINDPMAHLRGEDLVIEADIEIPSPSSKSNDTSSIFHLQTEESEGIGRQECGNEEDGGKDIATAGWLQSGRSERFGYDFS